MNCHLKVRASSWTCSESLKEDLSHARDDQAGSNLRRTICSAAWRDGTATNGVVNPVEAVEVNVVGGELYVLPDFVGGGIPRDKFLESNSSEFNHPCTFRVRAPLVSRGISHF